MSCGLFPPVSSRPRHAPDLYARPYSTVSVARFFVLGRFGPTAPSVQPHPTPTPTAVRRSGGILRSRFPPHWNAPGPGAVRQNKATSVVHGVQTASQCGGFDAPFPPPHRDAAAGATWRAWRGVRRAHGKRKPRRGRGFYAVGGVGVHGRPTGAASRAACGTSCRRRASSPRPPSRCWESPPQSRGQRRLAGRGQSGRRNHPRRRLPARTLPL